MKIARIPEIIKEVEKLTSDVFDGRLIPDNDDIASAHSLDEALGHLVATIELRADRK